MAATLAAMGPLRFLTGVTLTCCIAMTAVAHAEDPAPTTTPPAPPPADTTAPRVSLALEATQPVRRGRFVAGVGARIATSENGRCSGTLKAGTKTLQTIGTRDCFAGITEVNLRVEGKKALATLRRATRLRFQVTVKDAAGNAKTQLRSIELRR